MTCDDELIARQLRAGSADAWRSLYDTFAEAVWQCVARRVGPHAADVGDIVQETFLAAARGARSYDPARGSPWVWLSTIARRQTALHFRRKQTRPEATGGAGTDEKQATELQASTGEDDPAELFSAAETAQAVRQALGQLSVEYETLLVGKYMDGLSVGQLAEAEDCTIDAISSKLARARRAFREAYAQAMPATDKQAAKRLFSRNVP